MRQVYGGIINGRLFHIVALGRLRIHWFFDDNFENKFSDCPGMCLVQEDSGRANNLRQDGNV